MASGVGKIYTILNFLKKTGFLSVKHENYDTFNCIQFGPNGGLMLRNLTTEWFEANVTTKENIFILETNTVDADSKQLKSTASLDSREFFSEAFEFRNKQLPLGISCARRCFDLNNRHVPMLGLSRPAEFTELLLHYYVNRKSVDEVFHKMEVEHLRWWKKLSLRNHKFELRRTDKAYCDIIHHSPQGETKVEAISVHAVDNSTYLIESQTAADIGLLIYLHDAYTETECGKDVVMRFHQRLAPYKLGLLLSGARKEDLRVVADYIKNELRKEAILLFDFASEMSKRPSDSTIEFQHFGVPYAVILNDQTLEDGIVILHDQAASVKEQVHVTNITKKIVQFVKS